MSISRTSWSHSETSSRTRSARSDWNSDYLTISYSVSHSQVRDFGIRIIGEVTAEKDRIVQDADWIYRSEVEKAAKRVQRAPRRGTIMDAKPVLCRPPPPPPPPTPGGYKSSCLKKPVFMRVSAISISLLITN